MSNPFRGSDVAADMITSEDFSKLELFMRENMASLQASFSEIDQIAETGDEALFEEHFGHLSRPRPDPRGECLLKQEETQEHALCTMCRKVFAEDIEMSKSWFPAVHERYAHYKTLKELHDAATTGGCPLCAMLWTHIAADLCVKFDPDLAYTSRKVSEGRGTAWAFDYISFSISKSEDSSDHGYLLNFVYGGNDSGFSYDKVHSLQLGLVPITDSRFNLHEGEVSNNTGSHPALDFAARCVRRCEEEHTKCSRTALDNAWKPTRLVDLGPLDEPITSRLIITETPSVPIPYYATLSHRWGGANVFQLKLGNLDALRKEIPIDKLSKTFKDAFVAAKKLGVRYIWIDSLCIIQDSPDDWQKEAALMKNVYSNAKFNISATGAEVSDDGLFIDRGRLSVVPFTLEITGTAKSPSPWRSSRYHLVNPSLWSSNISQSPLNKRGWVLQERVLARQIVHFGRDQIFFECQELDACEMFPRGLPDATMFQQRALGAPSNGHFKRLDPELDGGWLRENKSMGRLKADPALNFSSIWAELVEAYSALSLTKWEDKLVAFSGIAKMMQQRPEMNGDVYLAGLWRRHLPYHMLWSRRKEGGLGTEPMIYIAPSWSWASVQAPVTLQPVTDGVNEEILVEILEAETYTLGEDVTGSVFGGYIKLRGFLRRAECAVWPRRRRYADRSIMDRTKLAMTPSGGPAEIIVWPDETDMFGAQDDMRETVYCLPIQMWQNDKGDRCTEGLILKQMDFDPNAFKRMGKFKISVGAKDGQREFYGVGDEVWEREDTSATAVMQEAAAFRETVITLV